MFFFPFITAVMLLAIGIETLRSNPRRIINQTLAAVCWAGVLFFVVQFVAKFQGAAYVAHGRGNPLLWIRIKFGIVAVICPSLVWLCYYTISGRYRDGRDLLRKMIPWICLSILLAVFAFTEGFIPNDSLPGREHYGPWYLGYWGSVLAGELAVCITTILTAPRLKGIRRLEFGFITIALGYLALAAVLTEIVYATWPSPTLHSITRVASYMVYIVFGISAWSVTSYRVYHTRQVLNSIARRMLVLVPIAALAVALLKMQQHYEPNAFASATVIALSMVAFELIDDKLRLKWRATSEHRLLDITHALRSIAERQSDPQQLVVDFERRISAFAKAEVEILIRDGDNYIGKLVNVSAASVVRGGSTFEGWYSLASRSRVNETASPDLRRLLEQHRATALLFPNWSASLATLMVLLGERENAVPFTYPELRLLVSLTNIVDALYTRCRLALQVRQAEQLAAIGRQGFSIAHELRNPMSTLRTFSLLLPDRLDDQEFLRLFAATVPPETERIEALTEQFLDLARPRKYELKETDMHELLDHAVYMSRSQVSEAGGQITTRLEASSRFAHVDRNAIKQVLLNLIRNATQALSRKPDESGKLIQVRTFDRNSMLVIEVEDSGPGIPEEIRGKLFEPFVSSETSSGLGLGLAVCREIVAVHAGEISAENAGSGGAVFRVALPQRSNVEGMTVAA